MIFIFHTYNYRSDEGQFYYDETLWHWRNQGADKFHEQEAEKSGYYGFKGIKRMTNTRIVVGCMGLIVFGGLLHSYYF